MSNLKCNETFSDILEVWPFVAGDIKFTTPFQVRKRIVTLSELGIQPDGSGNRKLSSLLSGRDYYSVGEDYGDDHAICLEERKAQLKSTSKMSAYGRSHELSLTLVVSDKGDKSVNMMDEIERARHDFILMTSDNQYLLVRSVENLYSVKSEEDFSENYQQKLTINMENINGIQRIIL